MNPTIDMLLLLEVVKSYLSSTVNPTLDPRVWCKAAGLEESQWSEWVSEHGQSFEDWFCLQLGLQRVERAAIDRVFWATLVRAMTGDKPSASHLNVWADIQGYKKEKPELPSIPVLSSSEAMEALASIPVAVLEQALQKAKER